jgi:hypothetical protein
MIINNDHNNWRKKTRFKVYMMFILAWTKLVSYFALKLLGHRHPYMQSMDQNHPLKNFQTPLKKENNRQNPIKYGERRLFQTPPKLLPVTLSIGPPPPPHFSKIK